MSKLEIFCNIFNDLTNDIRFKNDIIKITNEYNAKWNVREITIENIKNGSYSKINVDENGLAKYETEKDISIFIYRILLSAYAYIFNDEFTKDDAIKMLKSKMDGNTDASWEWAETVRLAINALEKQKEEVTQ